MPGRSFQRSHDLTRRPLLSVWRVSARWLGTSDSGARPNAVSIRNWVSKQFSTVRSVSWYVGLDHLHNGWKDQFPAEYGLKMPEGIRCVRRTHPTPGEHKTLPLLCGECTKAVASLLVNVTPPAHLIPFCLNFSSRQYSSGLLTWAVLSWRLEGIVQPKLSPTSTAPVMEKLILTYNAKYFIVRFITAANLGK